MEWPWQKSKPVNSFVRICTLSLTCPARILTMSDTGDSKHAVARIGTQLERLEQNVSKIQGSLQRVHGSDTNSNNGSNLESTRPSWTCPATSIVPDGSALRENVRHGVGRRAFRFTEGCETYSGPTSLHCLILDAQEFILAPMIRTGVVHKHEAVLFTDRLGALLVTPPPPARIDDSDDLSPAMPPMAMLEAMIGPYFDQINTTFPLWTRQGLRAQIGVYQAGHTACAVSANNVILLTLTAKFAQAVSQKPPKLSSEQTFSSMESELAGPFATNARRAARNTDRLLTPKLVNIQALLSLVRRAYFPKCASLLFSCLRAFFEFHSNPRFAVLGSAPLSPRRSVISNISPGSISLTTDGA